MRQQRLPGLEAYSSEAQQLEERIEAHIFVAFIAYCLLVTLRRRLPKLAPGLSPRALLEKFKANPND